MRCRCYLRRGRLPERWRGGVPKDPGCDMRPEPQPRVPAREGWRRKDTTGHSLHSGWALLFLLFMLSELEIKNMFCRDLVVVNASCIVW